MVHVDAFGPAGATFNFLIFEDRGTEDRTFDEGLQSQPTWSPDGRYIACSSDCGWKFDIRVQQVSSGGPYRSPKTGPRLAAGLVAGLRLTMPKRGRSVLTPSFSVPAFSP